MDEFLHAVTFATRPAVDFYVSKYVRGQFDPSVVLIQHVKRDTAQFVQTLIGHGIKVPFIIAIPYSVEAQAREQIAALGIEVITPEFENLADIAVTALRRLPAGESVIVQEVGGYLASTLGAVTKLGPVVCIVEETKNGLWRYEEVSESLQTPVIQVADTELKRIEAHFVGEAVCEAISDHVFNAQRTLRYMRVGVIGYGDIGAGVAEAMLRRRILPLVYDTDPVKLAGALTAGCRIGTLRNILDESDIVVGATGRTCFSCEDIRSRETTCYFASASSRDIEFPLEQMKQDFRWRQEGDSIRFDVSPSSLVIFANGFPINFSVRSLPPNISDLLFLLLSAAMRNYQVSSPRAGLHRLEPQFEKEAAEVFLQFHPR